MTLVLIIQPLFLLLISCHYVTAQTVALESSVGTRPACPGEMVTYTCTVPQGLLLEWIVEPFLPANDPVQFQSSDNPESSMDCNDFPTVNCSDFDFVATLTEATPDINSTLTFNVTARLNGTVIQCRGSTATATSTESSILNVAGIPTPPQTLSPTVQQYGRDNVTHTVQWQPPLDDGGALVNYTITVSPGLSPVTTSGTSVPVTLPYNVNHIVSIVATNCRGSSSATMETIRVANCSDPTVPRNGSIDPYQNTTEGAQIVFRCDSGLVPAEAMTAMCAVNGSWTPDPATVMCTSSGVRIHLPILTIVLTAIGALALAKEV